MLVNLWDNTFRHDVGATAGKPPTKINYIRDRMEWNGTTLFVDGCAAPETVRRVRSTRKVGWLHEPPCLHGEDYARVDWEGLDLVLTYYQPFLNHPKARLVPTGGVWIPRDRWGMKPKTKLCSMLYGIKTATIGHQMRPKVADAVRDLGIVDFYGAEGTPVGYGWPTKLTVLEDYAFSIIISTCWADNDFDEILGDCLSVGTIPLLWGFPNYDEWFYPEGILRFEKPAEARVLVESLNMDLYNEMKEAAEANLEQIGRYEITDDLVAEVLQCE